MKDAGQKGQKQMGIQRRGATGSPVRRSRRDTVEDCTNGDAIERRSAYAKALADKYDPPSLLRATEGRVEEIKRLEPSSPRLRRVRCLA